MGMFGAGSEPDCTWGGDEVEDMVGGRFGQDWVRGSLPSERCGATVSTVDELRVCWWEGTGGAREGGCCGELSVGAILASKEISHAPVVCEAAERVT